MQSGSPRDAGLDADAVQAEWFSNTRQGVVQGQHGIRRGDSAARGQLPINRSGGLLSKGRPIGATGTMQLCELVLQLPGEADERQAEDARIGLAEKGGGFHGLEEAACVATLLTAPGIEERWVSRPSRPEQRPNNSPSIGWGLG